MTDTTAKPRTLAAIKRETMTDTTAKPRTLAAIKRELTKGTTVTMIRHDWFPTGKLIGVPRAVERVQTNGVMFAGGSWLYWPKVKEFRATAEGFEVRLRPDEDQWLGYRLGE